VPSSVPHVLVDRSGLQIATASFGPAVRWNPGEIVFLASDRKFRVIERRDGDPVELVVEPA
jgi:hypothetical protein